MKKLLAIICASLLIVGCSQNPIDDKIGEDAQNPFIDYETLQDACKGAGMDIMLPDKIATYTIAKYRAIPNKLLEIIYLDNEEELRVRMSLTCEDNSGDYNFDTYDHETIEVDQMIVTLGMQNDLIKVAYWCDDNESFSMTCNQGISLEDLLALINTIHG